MPLSRSLCLAFINVVMSIIINRHQLQSFQPPSLLLTQCYTDTHATPKVSVTRCSLQNLCPTYPKVSGQPWKKKLTTSPLP